MDNVVTSEEEKRNTRKEQITLLVKTYYEKFDFLRNEPLENYLNKALALFLDSDLSMESVNDKIMEVVLERKKMFEANFRPGDMRDNQEKSSDKLERLTKMLNQEAIDYQISGALCGYLKYGEDIDGHCDDIEIELNEADTDRFKGICAKVGLSYENNRLAALSGLESNGQDIEHMATAKDPSGSFHIGLLPFKRLENGSVASRKYCHDDDRNAYVQETIISSELAAQVYGREKADFRGNPVTIASPEYVYKVMSASNNDKSKQDISFMESRIDKGKLEKINTLSKEGRVVQNIPVGELDNNTNNLENNNQNNNEIKAMMSDYSSSKNEEAKSGSLQMSSDKVLVKKQESASPTAPAGGSGNGEKGFINNVAVTALVFITFTLSVVGLTLAYLAMR